MLARWRWAPRQSRMDWIWAGGRWEVGGKRDYPCYVYILVCRDRTLYTGIARDLAARIDQHNAGKGAKYTRNRRPVRLVYYETHRNWGDALRREIEIKGLERVAKLRLCGGLEPDALGVEIPESPDRSVKID